MESYPERGFREIRVSPYGVQTVPSGGGDDDHHHPSIAPWRNNLTALSHVWNLYFIAYQSSIYVYQPQYPTQAIPSKPAIIIPLPVSQPGLRGYIDDSQFPHSVNNVLVADLGNQELLACVCDDGDVVVYYTFFIEDAIRQQREAKSELLEATNTHIKPFLVDNVGMSAWGIAIHGNGRMIAVSANTGNITVFAFALTDDPVESSDVSAYHYWSPISATSSSPTYLPDSTTDKALVPDRTKDERIVLIGNKTNIPNIAFCNTEDDLEGRWLASTDIEGHMLMWDIWLRKPVSIWNFGDQLLGEESTQGAMETIAGAGVYFVWIHDLLDPVKGAMSFSGVDPKQGKIIGKTLTVGFSLYSNYFLNTRGFANTLDPIFKRHIPHMSIRGRHQRKTPRDYFGPDEEDRLERWKTTLSFGVLHTSAKSIRLMGPIHWNHLEKISLLCHSPLAQVYPSNSASQLIHYERLNMLAQAPELGLVFIATQTGRVAVLSLTQGSHLPYGFIPMAFRIEFILPFASEEGQRLRPDVPLAGIAVGPIQYKAMDSLEGESRSERLRNPLKRIRLMMTYYDRTVLSYEISRTDSASFSADNELLAL